jgi:hypothetical protein
VFVSYFPNIEMAWHLVMEKRRRDIKTTPTPEYNASASGEGGPQANDNNTEQMNSGPTVAFPKNGQARMNWGLLGPEVLGSQRRMRTLGLGTVVRKFNDLAVPGMGGVWFGKQLLGVRHG